MHACRYVHAVPLLRYPAHWALALVCFTRAADAHLGCSVYAYFAFSKLVTGRALSCEDACGGCSFRERQKVKQEAVLQELTELRERCAWLETELTAQRALNK